MKNLYIIFCFVLSGSLCYAQKEIKFSIKYSPERTYIVAHNKTSAITVDFKGDTTMENKMKAAGISFPLDIKTENQFVATTNTGKTDPISRETPVHITISKLHSKKLFNGVEMDVPPKNTDSLISGKLLKNGVMYIDTTGVDGNKFRKALISMYNNLRNQVRYPDKPMKKGDFFTQKVPLSVPVPGSKPVVAQISTTYKLKKIADNKAYFDVDMSITSSDTIVKAKETMSGAGNGKLIFDLTENFILNYDTTINLTMYMEMDATSSFLIKISAISKTQALISR